MKKNLDQFLDNSFIPSHLIYRKKDNNEYEKIIYLYLINDLKVSNEEKEYITKYIKNKGIIIKGHGNKIDFDSDYYDDTSKSTSIIKGKKLSKEETKEKLKKYQETKDINLRNEIVLGNLGLVSYVIKTSYTGIDSDYQDDLNQRGYIGLIKAVENYDFTKGAFSTFAVSYIKGHIKSQIYELNGLKHGDYLYYSTKRKVEETYNEKLSDNENLAKVIGKIIDEKSGEKIGPNKITKDVIIRKVLLLNPLSLESLEENENIYKLGYEEDDSDLEEVYEKEMITKLHKEIKKLKESKQKLLEHYYGLNNEIPKSTTKIAKLNGVTHQAINSQLKNALNDLRETEEIKSLRRYLK